MGLGRVCSVFNFLASLCILAVWIAHVFSSFKQWCRGDNCVGPWLRWSDNDFFHDLNAAPFYRSVFTLNINIVTDLWAPTFLGLLAVFQHIKGMKNMTVSQSWLTSCFFLLFCAFFGCFGYAGNFGIIMGFMVTLGSLVCLIANFACPNESNTLDIGR